MQGRFLDPRVRVPHGRRQRLKRITFVDHPQEISTQGFCRHSSPIGVWMEEKVPNHGSGRPWQRFSVHCIPLKFKVSSARFYSISAKINQFLKIWTNLHCDLTIHSGDNLPRTRRNETRQESGDAGGVRREGKPQAKMKKGNGKSTEECPCPKSRTCPEKPSSPSQTKL